MQISIQFLNSNPDFGLGIGIGHLGESPAARGDDLLDCPGRLVDVYGGHCSLGSFQESGAPIQSPNSRALTTHYKDTHKGNAQFIENSHILQYQHIGISILKVPLLGCC